MDYLKVPAIIMKPAEVFIWSREKYVIHWVNCEGAVTEKNILAYDFHSSVLLQGSWLCFINLCTIPLLVQEQTEVKTIGASFSQFK